MDETDVIFYDLMKQLREFTENYTFAQFQEDGGTLTKEGFEVKKVNLLEKHKQLYALHKEVDELTEQLLLR